MLFVSKGDPDNWRARITHARSISSCTSGDACDDDCDDFDYYDCDEEEISMHLYISVLISVTVVIRMLVSEGVCVVSGVSEIL